VRDLVVSDVPLPRVIMAFRIPAYTSPDFAVAEVSRAVLGVGRASRFYKRLVRERRVATSVVTYAFPLLTGASMLLVWATGFPETDPDALERALVEELDALVEVAQGEIDRAIALTETDLVRTLERVSERADLLSMFEMYFDDPGRLNDELDRLREVTLDQIRGFVETRLGTDNRAVVTYVPESRA
jgi:predicted Zn-dependent peptidase